MHKSKLIILFFLGLTITLATSFILFKPPLFKPSLNSKEQSKIISNKKDNLNINYKASQTTSLAEEKARNCSANVTHSNSIESQNKLVVSQKKQINELLSTLKFKEAQYAALLKEKNQVFEVASKPVSMNDLQNQMQERFMQQLTNVTVKATKNQIEDFMKHFEETTDRAHWNSEYELKISEFITHANQNSLHFIDELVCKESLCRLKISTSESDNWNSIMSQLNQQDWYQSLTFYQLGENPSSLIYYITEPKYINKKT